MAQQVQVASAAFCRLECSHEQLFQPEYKRSNRTKGVKILRCFPHCCPDHVDRSYCGCSLNVRVELAAQSSQEVADDNVALFARFEALSDVSLKPGECVQVDKMAAATQCEGNPEAQWVAGSLDQPSRLVAATDTPSDDQKSLVFHLNHKTFARWYYDWESGANKAQRLMKHVFKAYVVQHCAVDQDNNFVAVDSPEAQTQFYRVLHVATSPEFTVISYRRSQAEQYQLSLHEIPDQEANQDEMSRYDEDYYLAGESPRTERPQSPVKLERVSPRPAPPRSIDTASLLESKLRWEYTNLATVAISRNLALVYSFLRWAPLNAYASFVDELVHLLHHSLQVSLSGFSHQISRLNCFSKLVFGQVEADESTAVASSFVHGRRTPGSAPTTLPREMETLLYTLMQATLWLFSTETRQWMRTFFQQHAPSVTDKRALRASFVLFLQQLEERLNTQVLQRTALRSLDNVAEEIIGSVYSYEYFHGRRPQVREILSGQNFMGWTSFVAQMSETYINVSTHPSVPRELVRRAHTLNFDEAHTPRNEMESAWNAEWLMDVDEAVWKFHENVENADFSDANTFARAGLDGGAVSLFTMFEIISQLVRVEIALDVHARTLHVRSRLGVAGSLDCMRLVLDGQERVFSMFPNGLASAIDPCAYGDYVGEMQVDESGRLVVYLQMFKWAAQEEDPSYRIRMRIECWRGRRLCISGDVLVTSAPSSFASDEVASVNEMSLTNKREAVERAFAQQLREDPSAKWTAPWRELGRFRLSYLK